MLKNQNELLKWQGMNNKCQIEINIHKRKKKQNRMLFSCIIARIIKTCALFWQACSTTLQLCFVRVGICFWVWRKGRQMQEEFWGGAWRKGNEKEGTESLPVCQPTSQQSKSSFKSGDEPDLHAANKMNSMLRDMPSSTFSPQLHPILLMSSQPGGGGRCLVTSVPQQNLTFQFQYL